MTIISNTFVNLFYIGIVAPLLFFNGKNKDSVNQFIWISRPLRVIYTVMTYLASLFMAILTLYVLNDWVLVTFILFILGAVIWSSKQYLPSFVEQSKIVLNLGAIRENERIIFQELPWQIKSLGYYCRLVNPALSGGQLRINTRELLSHHSRPLFDHEPWFPTSSGDWIELEAGDGKIFGKVDLQSPDQVAVKLVGGATKFFQTAEFVKLNPINLSKGYCVEYSFGIDYRHQDIILTKVIPNLRSDVKEMIWDSISHLKEDFEEFSIEFSSANESSLDFRFFLKCKGSIASQKQSLERKTQSIIVEVCNKYQYVIPFNQLTVHLNKDEEK